jgi:hypothetical protein
MDFKHITCNESQFPNLITSSLLKIGLFTSHKSVSRFVKDVLSICGDEKTQTKTRYIIEMLRMCVYLMKITTLHYELESYEIKLLLIYILFRELHEHQIANLRIPALLHKHTKPLGFKKQTDLFKTIRAYEILLSFNSFYEVKHHVSQNKLNLSINENVIREKIYSILRLSDMFYTIKSFPIHSYYFLKRFENRDIGLLPIYYHNIVNFLETDVLFHIKILEKHSKYVFAIRQTTQIVNDNIKLWKQLM